MTETFKKAMFEVFDKLQKNTIRVLYDKTENSVPIGGSKIGGRPDLPADFVWPYYEGEDYQQVVVNRPLSFLTQINLAETTSCDVDQCLPKTGILSFFYEMETEKWGFDPKDRGCARVFYFPDENMLIQTEFPEELHEDFRFPEFSLSFEARKDLPSGIDFTEMPEEEEISRRFPDETEMCDIEEYDALRQEYGCALDGDWSANTKLLGYPDVIQNSMERECEEVTRGIYNGGVHEVSQELEEEIEKNSKDWMLLYQMGVVEKDGFELMFGDVGHIYFWIKKQDLEKRNFDNVWLILQCC